MGLSVMAAAGLGVVMKAIIGVERHDDASLNGVHAVESVDSLLNSPSLTCKSFFGKEEIVAVVHEANRIASQRILVVTGGKINSVFVRLARSRHKSLHIGNGAVLI